MSAPSIIGPLTRTVGIASLPVLEVNVRSVDVCVIFVENKSLTQTYTGVIGSRLLSSGVYAPSSLGDLAEIPPGEARSVQVNCASVSELQLELAADGAGGEDADITVFGGEIL